MSPHLNISKKYTQGKFTKYDLHFLAGTPPFFSAKDKPVAATQFLQEQRTES